MKKRVFVMLRQLVAAGGYLSAERLASELGLSKRAALYALDEADRLLEARGLAALERIPGTGIRIADDSRPRVQEFLDEMWEDQSPIDVAASSDRRLFLLFAFMCSEGRHTTDSLAAGLGVSVRTISNDISVLRSSLERQRCKLTYERSCGYRVVGNEFSRRCQLIAGLQDACPVRGARGLSSFVNEMGRLVDRTCSQGSGRDEAHGAAGPSSSNELVSEDRLIELERVLEGVLPGVYERDIRHIVLMNLVVATIERRQNLSWGLTAEDCEHLRGSASFELARFVVAKASELLNRKLGEDESYYMGMLLQPLPQGTREVGKYPFDLEVVAQKLIAQVEEGYGFDFSRDAELPGMIVAHLMPLTYRMLFKMQIANPLVGEVASKYGRLHAQVREAMGEVERFVGSPVREDEAAFLTLYFASSVEKLANVRDGAARVVVVCNAGTAVSRLLQYRLANAFNVDVITAVSEQGLYELFDSPRRPSGEGGDVRLAGGVVGATPSVDLIVSIIDVDERRCAGVPVLKVSPFLSDEDYELLGRRLARKQGTAILGSDEGLSLLELLAPKSFCIRERVADMDELIKLGGGLLAEDGLCDEEYPREMVRMAHSFGPLTTILIAPEIIMPHAGISDHVYKTGFSFVRLAEPVEVNGKQVRCAISLCTRDKRINQRAIQQLGILLRGERFIREVVRVNTFAQLSNLVSECLKGEAERGRQS